MRYSGIGNDQLNIIERVSFPTAPEETMDLVIVFFKKYPLKAIGIGFFGPIDIHKDSATYGQISSTPKLAWQDYTIGTGVGADAIQTGSFIEGFSHPEMGHMIVKRHPDDSFEGSCLFHRDCLEGMAAGPAIEKRVGKKDKK